MKCWLMVLVGFVLLMGTTQGSTFARQCIDLDGTWNFELVQEDGQKTSLTGTQKGTIQVPGIWENQGFGGETEKVRHSYVGVGRYERTVTLPESWAGLEPVLVMDGISRYAQVYIDGKKVGAEAIGCIGAHEVPLAGHVLPGQTVQLRIDVDSRQRWEVDALLGCGQIIDYMHIPWGGLWSHVRIEGRPKTYLKSVYVRSKINPPTAIIETEISTETSTEKNSGNAAAVKVLRVAILDAQGNTVVVKDVAVKETSADSSAPNQKTTVEIPVPDGRLWTPDQPNLYTANVSLLYGDQNADTIQTRFGIREITTDGYRLLLNGKRLFLRGYGDDHIYPHEFAMPTDKAMHVKRLRLIKQFGFNHVRHHSTIMPEEYYDACDEVGIMPTAEFLIGYPQYLPGKEEWLKKVPAGTTPDAALDVYRERFTAVVRQYRNHPCILVWVMGNELWNGMSINDDFMTIAKTNDPDRLFMDTDGEWADYIFNPANDRKSLDLYTPLFNEWSNPCTNSGKFDTGGKEILKPSVSHEAGNYTTFIRTDQAAMFDGTNYIPFWMTAGLARLKVLGLENEAKAWSEASEKLYFQLHKANVEQIRKNEKLSGYHWWLVQDYWTTSNGLVDYFFRPKSISPESVRAFNSDCISLLDGLELTCRKSDPVEVKKLISNYSTDTSRYPAGLSELGKITIPISSEMSDKLSSGQPVEVTLQGELLCPNTPANSWTTWVFPDELLPEVSDSAGKPIPVFADNTCSTALPDDWNLPKLPETGDLPSDAVYITDWLNRNIADALNRGAKVILLNASSILPAIAIPYQSTWWKAGDSVTTNHNGTYIYDEPMISAFAPENYGHPGWAYLLDGAFKYNVEKIPGNTVDGNTPDQNPVQNPSFVKTIIRAIPSLVRVEDTAVLFEVRIGKGTLIVSGLNHRQAKDRPENAWVLRQMIRSPKLAENSPTAWPLESVRPVVSLPAGTTLGFQRLITRQPEMSVWFSLRHDRFPTYICRQNSTSNELTWQTAPVECADESADGNAVFIFAGGLGFLSQAKTAGFKMTVEGLAEGTTAEIVFDTPDWSEVSDIGRQSIGPQVWKSDDETVSLQFETVRLESNGQDRLGLYRLTIPKSKLAHLGSEKAGSEKTGVVKTQPVTITVRSLGSGSARWFGLNPEFNLCE